jgi:hypothetical protein
MPHPTTSNLRELHDTIVSKAAETIFRKQKVVINPTDNKVVSVGDSYPDLVIYEVLSIKPFIASHEPSMVGEVEVEDHVTEEMVAKWKKIANLDIDKLVLIVPESVKDAVIKKTKDVEDKIEVHTYNEKLYIS